MICLEFVIQSFLAVRRICEKVLNEFWSNLRKMFSLSYREQSIRF